MMKEATKKISLFYRMKISTCKMMIYPQLTLWDSEWCLLIKQKAEYKELIKLMKIRKLKEKEIMLNKLI